MRFIVLILFSTGAFAQGEKHLRNITMLTHGGDNAEAYFSPDGKRAVFQSNNRAWGVECDQIFDLDIQRAAADSAFRPKMLSSGNGRTTCSYYLNDARHILYASTEAASSACPPLPESNGRYVWPVYSDYDIYLADTSGRVISNLTNHAGYDAEATVSPKGDLVVFTSDRSGDLELWTMRPDGSQLRQVTNGLGYDGGAFFSPDGSKLVFRASRPSTPGEQTEYRELLKRGLVAPTNMELYVCNIDGSDLRQVTHLGKANWAPFFHPGGKKIIFSSNHHSDRGYDFQLFMVNLDGTGLEQVTNTSRFNAFPMFSRDGKRLIFSSNRNNGGTRDTNLFIADWTD